MEFDEVESRYQALALQARDGRISRDEFVRQVNDLAIQDGSGRWWQPDPQQGGWIFWDGVQWRPGTPPAAPARPSPPSTNRRSSPPSADGHGQWMDIGTFRQISRDLPWKERPQRWWDLFSILGGVAGAGVWFVYSSIAASTEGFDLLTPVVMIGLPVVLVLYRRQIDQFLIPLQPYRRRVPRNVLTGMSLVIPFLTAFLLYNLFGLSNYPLITWNILIGTVASYALVREPVLAKGYVPSGGPGLRIPLALLVGISVCVRLVMADDWLTNPLNANDALRTQGVAQMFAGLAGAGESVLVNGPEIARRQVAPGAGGGAYDLDGAVNRIPDPEVRTRFRDWLDQMDDSIRGRIRISADGRSIFIDDDPTKTRSIEDFVFSEVFNEGIWTNHLRQNARNLVDSMPDDMMRTLGTRERWRAMSEEERSRFMRDLVNLLGRATGQTAVNVVEIPPSERDARVPGFWQNGAVHINPDFDLDVHRRLMIDVLAHEVEHGRQNRGPHFHDREADILAKDRENYRDPTRPAAPGRPPVDIIDYYTQYSERSSRYFGQECLNAIKGRLGEMRGR